MMTHWPSPAKLNLFLYITGQRVDGYHTLQTLFQFIDYGDTISIELRQDGQICLLTPVDGVAHEDNLIVRAARLLMKAAAESGRLPAGSGADIRIEKRLPMGGGLGGGSSNAATVLVALNHLWGCAAGETELGKNLLQSSGRRRQDPVWIRRGHIRTPDRPGDNGKTDRRWRQCKGSHLV